MFTLKLKRGQASKIMAVAGAEIIRHEDGTAEIVALSIDGTQSNYLISDPKRRAAAGGNLEQHYDLAYVENERGSTTEIVRPR